MKYTIKRNICSISNCIQVAGHPGFSLGFEKEYRHQLAHTPGGDSDIKDVGGDRRKF